MDRQKEQQQREREEAHSAQREAKPEMRRTGVTKNDRAKERQREQQFGLANQPASKEGTTKALRANGMKDRKRHERKAQEHSSGGLESISTQPERERKKK